MKNKILIGATVLSILSPLAYADEISSHVPYYQTWYDGCNNIRNQTTKQACLSCFQVSNPDPNAFTLRSRGRITFNTDTLECTIDDDSRYQRYDRYQDCLDDDIDDECYNCLYGKYDTGMISSIDDGDTEYRGIVFMYDTQDYDYFCYIENPSLIACAPGWYGKPYDTPDSISDYLEGCKKCPATSPVTGAPKATTDTVLGGTLAITDCYIPMNKTFTDRTGTYKYTSDCHYTK
ncbi:MAG: hypothetical protein NC311_01680 [Muribaculaceae bacterium]|nr:hypothetical protein [Muribaculaceae bacterium]